LQTKALPKPNINEAVNSLQLAVVSGFTFVARSYAYDVRHLRDTIKQAIQHKGLAFIDCLQPCPTYNNITTKAWYAGEDRLDHMGKPQSRLYKLEQTGFNPEVHDCSEDLEKKVAAITKAKEWDDKIPIGVFYKNELEPTFEARIKDRIFFYLDRPPAKQKLCDKNGLAHVDLSEFMEDLKTS
jgi:2-oxoglutarate ferredoxin oxidoreductase subunit beta